MEMKLARGLMLVFLAISFWLVVMPVIDNYNTLVDNDVRAEYTNPLLRQIIGFVFLYIFLLILCLSVKMHDYEISLTKKEEKKEVKEETGKLKPLEEWAKEHQRGEENQNFSKLAETHIFHNAKDRTGNRNT